MIGIVSDHGGYKLKTEIIKYFEEKNIDFLNYGTDSEISVDYPDYAKKLCGAINKKEIKQGIAICGSGIGISIACNKIKNIRCAKVDSEKESFYTRDHNDSNVIALNGTMDIEKAKKIIDIFLNTDFSNDERHTRRINKIKELEND